MSEKQGFDLSFLDEPKRRGRPPKERDPDAVEEPKRPRGRPRKTEEEKKETKRKKDAKWAAKAELGMPSQYELDRVEAGENAKYLAHAMQVRNMPQIDISDVAQVEKRINDYFLLCVANDVRPTAAGFRNSLGISKQTISDWRLGKHRTDSHQAAICRGYDVLENLWEDYMLNGKVNPVSGIFLGKANFGIVERNELVVTPNTATIDSVDVKTIEAKYAELPDDDD